MRNCAILLTPGGGYDFPGSNSGVDLFSLTGWIPERIFFPKNPLEVRDFETPSERAWERLCSASSYGDCLVTMSSSTDLDEGTADEVGLVTGHAYAVLSVLQTRNGTRLIQMKNPWAYKVSLKSIESSLALQSFFACTKSYLSGMERTLFMPRSRELEQLGSLY